VKNELQRRAVELVINALVAEIADFFLPINRVNLINVVDVCFTYDRRVKQLENKKRV